MKNKNIIKKEHIKNKIDKALDSMCIFLSLVSFLFSIKINFKNLKLFDIELFKNREGIPIFIHK